MTTSDKTEVELRIYSCLNKKDLAKRIFQKIFSVSSASLKTLLEIGTKIPPVAGGLREGVVRNVVRPKGCLIQVWIETKSHVEDLLERLPSAGWKEISG